MSRDILADARNEILNEHQAALPQSPSELCSTYEQHVGIAGAVSGMAAGASFGAGIGIAAGPLGAIAGTVPCAIIGGIIGYFGGAKIGSQVEQS